MNFPYKWTNSIDEEDDQGSSWRVSLKEKRQTNSRAWRHLMTNESGARLEGTGSPDEEGGLIRDQHFTTLPNEDEQASGGLNHLASRNAGGTPWTWKKVTTAEDSGAAENVMPKSRFPKYPLKKRRGPRMEKGSKDQEESPSRIMGSKSLSVRNPEGFVRNSTWHSADVRRDLQCQRERPVHQEG